METITSQDLETLAILQTARRILRTEDHWCKDNYVMNERGQQTTQGADDAFAYCLDGALARAAREVTGTWDMVERKDPARKLLAATMPKRYSGVIGFNDAKSTTHIMVLNLIDEAIERVGVHS